MSLGIFLGKIDNSGRTKLPSPLRDYFAEQFMDKRVIITNSLPFSKGDVTYSCSGLSIFLFQDWQHWLEYIENDGTLSDVFKESFNRRIIEPAKEHVIDNNGRIRVAKNLRVISNIDSEQEIVFVNLGYHIDIWNMDSWTNVEHVYKHKLQVPKSLR